MTNIDSNQKRKTGRRVQILLTSPRITSAFRDVILAAASDADMTPGEFALMAAGEKLKAAGARFTGVFTANEDGPGAFREIQRTAS